jgi:hypothetical protein
MLEVEDIAVEIPAFVGIPDETALSGLVPSAIIMFPDMSHNIFRF